MQAAADRGSYVNTCVVLGSPCVQAAAVCVLDVSSTVALQLPALQGALAKSFGLYAAFLQVSGAPERWCNLR